MNRVRHNLLLWSAALAACVLCAAPAAAQGRKATRLQGRIVRVEGTDQFVVRTTDNKEFVLYADPQTEYLVNKKAARFADLRQGSDVVVYYDRVGKRHVVRSVAITPRTVVEDAPAGTTVEGRVVRVEGKDQLILRTPKGEEVIVLANPETTYLLDDQPARLVDVRPGATVRVTYNVRGRRNQARSVVIVTPRRR